MSSSNGLKLPILQANLSVDVRRLLGLPQDAPSQRSAASVAELALQKIQEAVKSGDRRSLIDALQVYNKAVGAQQSQAIAELESPFVSTPEVLRRLPIIQTTIQRDILANSRDHATKMADETLHLWGSSHQSKRELNHHFFEVSRQLSQALEQFDQGHVDAAFGMYRRALWDHDAHMAWMGRDLRHSKQLKKGVVIGITAVAGAAAVIATDGVALAVLGEKGVAALSGGAQLGLLTANSAAFVTSHRVLEQQILDTPFLRKEGVAANVIDMGTEIVKAAGVMGSIKAAAKFAPAVLPLPKHEVALIAGRNFGFEYGAMNVHAIATGMDPRLLVDAHYHADQLSFLLGLKGASAVITSASAAMKTLKSRYASFIESPTAARLALLPLAALGMFAVPGDPGKKLGRSGQTGTALAKPGAALSRGLAVLVGGTEKVGLLTNVLARLPLQPVQAWAMARVKAAAQTDRAGAIQLLVRMLFRDTYYGWFEGGEKARLEKLSESPGNIQTLTLNAPRPLPRYPSERSLVAAPPQVLEVLEILRSLGAVEAAPAICRALCLYDDVFRLRALEVLFDWTRIESARNDIVLYLNQLLHYHDLGPIAAERLQKWLTTYHTAGNDHAPAAQQIDTLRSVLKEQPSIDQKQVETLLTLMQCGTVTWPAAAFILDVIRTSDYVRQLGRNPLPNRENGPPSLFVPYVAQVVATWLRLEGVTPEFATAAMNLFMQLWWETGGLAHHVFKSISENPNLPLKITTRAHSFAERQHYFIEVRLDNARLWENYGWREYMKPSDLEPSRPDIGHAVQSTRLTGNDGKGGPARLQAATTATPPASSNGPRAVAPSFMALWDEVRRVLFPPSRPMTRGIPEENVRALQLEREYEGQHPLRNSTAHRLIADYFKVSIARAEFLLPYLAHLVGSGMATLPAALQHPELLEAIEKLQRQSPSVTLSQVAGRTDLSTQITKDMLHAAVAELPAPFKPMLDQVTIRARPLTDAPVNSRDTFGAQNGELFVPPMFKRFMQSGLAPQIVLFPEFINPTFQDPIAKALAVRSILMHEFGHYLGLDHPQLRQLGLY